MARKKQTIIHNGTSPKGGTNTNTRDKVPPYAANRERIIDDIGSSLSQRVVTQPLLFEGHILQMLVDMKEQMKEHQA